MVTLPSDVIGATQVSEYHRSLGNPSVLFVEGIGPIAQYDNYIDFVEEKGLRHFARDYRAWLLNSKLILKKMPPKNTYKVHREVNTVAWADMADDHPYQLTPAERDRRQRDIDTPYTLPKPKFVSRGSHQVKPVATSTETRNAFDMLPELPELPGHIYPCDGGRGVVLENPLSA